MSGYLRRLLKTSLAYQVSDLVSKPLAIILLPIYTRHLSESDYGTAELIASAVIFASIVVRLGIGEAFVRYHYEQLDAGGRNTLARRSVLTLLALTTTAALLTAAAAAPISDWILGYEDPSIIRIAALGLWAFSNLELAQALLRVEERVREYAIFAITNVALTVSLTVWLVVFRGDGANGLLFGNYAASAAVLLAMWIWERERLRAAGGAASGMRTLLRFGLPTVPADASVFALNLIDRAWIFHGRSAAAAGLYSIAVKLSGGMIALARGFQYAWPPLAYSVKDDTVAARLYASVFTWYAAVTGMAVAGMVLLGRWLVRLLAAPSYFDAYKALPWVALGWALYGLVQVMVAVAGRAKVTTRNFPAALAGLAANVILLALLVGPLGIEGAGMSLCGAYLVMIVVLRLLTRGLFEVRFEWLRLAHLLAVAGGLAVGGNLLLATSGIGGLVSRLAVLVAIAPLLWLTSFVRPDEKMAFSRGFAALRLRLARTPAD
jgi:O-antigen/teichoic acid export membrane protein